MQTDELREELTDLANEVEPFAGDVSAVRRRVARRRRVAGSIAAVVVVVLAGSAIAITRSNPHRLEVAGSTKEVRAADLPRVDAAVVMPVGATEDDLSRVQSILDDSHAVEQYAEPPTGSLALALLLNPTLLGRAFFGDPRVSNAELCANQATRAFAVELVRTPSASKQLTTEVGTDATVKMNTSADADAEIFMKVKASDHQIEAVAAQLKADRDIVSYRFLDHNAAYDEFKKLFADQPVLIQNQTPEALPESFRLTVRDGASDASVAAHYENLPGVDQVILRANPLRSIFGADSLKCPKTP